MLNILRAILKFLQGPVPSKELLDFINEGW
jgi:hypothetical protein